MIELLMLDSSRDLAEARRFRAKVVAQTLAENAAELAALNLAQPSAPAVPVEAEDWQGTMRGTVRKTAAQSESGSEQQLFTLSGVGEATGTVKSRATVRVNGRIIGSRIVIDYAQHSQ